MIGKINDYTQVRSTPLKQGGSVWEFESVNKKKYAIKLIPVDNDTKEDTKKQAEIYIKLDHPNILKARQFFFCDQETVLAIVLQFCPDKDLSHRIGKIQHSQCEVIMKQITEGLYYLHQQQGIIHRDLKPQNILMFDGLPKIGDMGFAKLMKFSGLTSKTGAQYYRAPEVFNERKYGYESDIWSLGIIFFQLLAGKRIFQMNIRSMAPAFQPNFPSQTLLSTVHEKEYIPLLKKMLMKDPLDRSSSKQVLQMLEAIKIQKAFQNLKVDERKKFPQMSEENLTLLESDTCFPKLIEIVELGSNRLNDAGLQKIVLNAHKFPYLVELYLPRNNITCDGLIIMAKSQGKFPKLQFLRLQQNQISDDGLIALAQNGRNFPKLKCFNLSQNKIKNNGLKSFAQNGQKWPELQYIDLSSNSVSDEGLKEFLEKGRNFSQLNKIVLDKNDISSKSKEIFGKQQKFKFIISL